MDYYVVTAVSEEGERNVSCDATSNENCSITLNGNPNDYNFSVYSITHVNDSLTFTGDSASDCGKVKFL